MKSDLAQHFLKSSLDFFDGFDRIDLKKTRLIVISGVVPVVIYAVFSLHYKFPPPEGGSVNWILSIIIMSGIIAPIAEEFVTKGIILNLFVLFSDVFKLRPVLRYFVLLLGVLFVSWVFVISHSNVVSGTLEVRFIGSVFSSFVYLFDKRNLALPIISHAAYNWVQLTVLLINVF